MTPAVLLLALANVGAPVPIIPPDPWNPPNVFACETIEDLNPGGPLFDMVDWTTLDADLRATSHLASEPNGQPGTYGGAYVLQTHVTQDRITYLKTLTGDTWDVNLIDDVGIWSWRTEYAWNTPHSFTQFRRVNQILSAPRIGRGGFPGMRWVNCDTAFAAHVACGTPTGYGHLGYVIHELWGPYYYDPGYGDIAGLVLKLAYFYGCTTPAVESCSTVEITWTHKRFGLFAWRQYDRRGGEWTLTYAPPPVVYVVPGVIREAFPCDQEMP